jgi:fructoselysine 6-kinase
MRVLGMTVACQDLYVHQGETRVGGNAVNFLTCCRRLGTDRCTFVGAVGDDEAGRAAALHLQAWGIDASHLYVLPGATASNRIHVGDDGERRFLPDSWRSGVYGDFRLAEEDWRFALEHDVWAMAAVDPNAPEALRRRTGRQTVVIDFLDTADLAGMERALSRVDLLFASGDEALAEGMSGLARRSGQLLVTTLGAGGSVAFHGGEVAREPALPVPAVVDTTGCGDAFQAAFTLAWLERAGLQQALRAGAWAAAEVIGRLGGCEPRDRHGDLTTR